jgi:single-stranded-DNA-specific exonuclease
MISGELASALNVHPLVAEILLQRECDTVEAARAFLDPNYYTPTSPFVLPDVDRAVERLRRAIDEHEPIRIWGDFDVDGQTATSVLLLGLREMGAVVDYTIPNRATHSHGLNNDGIRKAQEDGVGVLLTCDCGVTDVNEIVFAQRLGLDVIVSDHHDLGEVLPNAHAIVNPKRLPADHALYNLPGVGVAYKLIEAISAAPSPRRASALGLLDLVALGIVADVAYQRRDTRYLLQLGLAQLRRSPRPGIRALMRSAGIDPLNFTADDIGFQIGPRLNAAGRLATASLSVELLTCDNDSRAAEIALNIEALNAERKRLQLETEREALDMLRRDVSLTRHAAIVLQSARWNASLIGVAANAIVNHYHKPALLIAGGPGDIGRGSARSVEGIDIHAAIAAQTHLIEGGGGHPMAAGFSIRSENVPAFREAVSRHIEQQLATSTNDAWRTTDTFPVAWRDVNLTLAEQIETLAPFGAGNPRPTLRSEHLKIVRAEPLGKDGKHQTLYVQDANGNGGRATWWRSVGQPVPEASQDVTMTFTLQRDLFNSRARAQVVVQALVFDGKAVQADEALASLTASFLIRDLRAEADRVAAVKRLAHTFVPANVQVLSASEQPSLLSEFSWGNRARLKPSVVLVVWDAPPGPHELGDALQRSQPQTVILVCVNGANDDLPALLQHTAQMMKTAEQRGDSLDDANVVARMAARINQREATMREAITLIRAGKADSPRLRYLLDETRAYRRFTQEAAAEEVLRVGVEGAKN